MITKSFLQYPVWCGIFVGPKNSVENRSCTSKRQGFYHALLRCRSSQSHSILFKTMQQCNKVAASTESINSRWLHDSLLEIRCKTTCAWPEMRMKISFGGESFPYIMCQEQSVADRCLAVTSRLFIE